MKIPFFSRYIQGSSRFWEMEEITDRVLRGFLQKPWSDSPETDDFIYKAKDEDKIKIVEEQMKQMLPVFCKIACCLPDEADDRKIADETGVILPYISTLREIAGRQQMED